MSSQTDSPQRRAARIRHIVEDVLARRAAGEQLPDSTVIAGHRGLMPELGRELGLLGLLERARGATSPRSGPVRQVAPDAFPGYEVVGEVHRGGQGMVYEAVHTPTDQRVAIKVMRDGIAGDPKDASRFEREVQILAELDHPGIVGIRASGVHDGRFYYVMDFVDGVLLDTYAAGQPLRRRLEVFVQVCDAVNAAHLKGVIHRDLKPGNIMVDAKGRVLILDFGLARLGAEGGATVTATGQFVGTMPWASPEQAAGESSKIDVRTDVYSLGVVLYHLLVGRFPYPVDGGPRDVLDNILRAEPARPRGIDRTIPVDVEAIVLKCLAKERGRRYQSAGELGEDLRRYLSGWPVAARPPSTIYQIGKFARRNKGAVAAGGAVMMAVAAGVVATGLALVRAVHAEGVSEQRRQLAQQEARAAEAASGYLESLLQMGTPEFARGRDTSVLREMLDRARKEVGARYADQPDLQARLRAALAKAYRALGALDEAEAEGRLALALTDTGPELNSAERVTALGVVGLVLLERNRPGDGVPFLEQALDLSLRRGPADSDDALAAKLNLAIAYPQVGRDQDAEQLQRAVIAAARQTLPARQEVLNRALTALAATLYDTGRIAEALALNDEAIEGRTKSDGEDHPSLVTRFETKSFILGMLGRDDEATAAATHAVDLARRILPPDHPDTISAILRLATCLTDQRETARAEPLAREALALTRAKYGPSHFRTAEALFRLGLCRHLTGKPDEAEPLYREALAIYPREDAHCPVAVTDPMCTLAAICLSRGENAQAESLYREALERRVRQYGDQDLRSAATMIDLAETLARSRRYAEAEPHARRALEIKSRCLQPGDPWIADAMRKLVMILLRQDKAADAAPLLEQVIIADGKQFGNPSWRVASGMIAHASCLIKLRELPRAEQELAAVAAMYTSIPELPPVAAAALAEQMAGLYDAYGDHDKAAQYRAQLHH